MGGKQSKVVRNSFSRMRLNGKKTRVLSIRKWSTGGAAKLNRRNSKQTISASTAPRRRLDWDDLVIEDLEDVPTDTLFGLDAASPLGSRAADYVAHSLLKVAQWDVMSVHTDEPSCDSDLLSTLGGGGEETERGFSLQLSDSDSLDLSELVLVFAAKEKESVAMDKLPDYVLFMSLPDTADLH